MLIVESNKLLARVDELNINNTIEVVLVDTGHSLMLGIFFPLLANSSFSPDIIACSVKRYIDREEGVRKILKMN